MSSNVLNIVMTTDDNYIYPTMVAISSMVSNGKADSIFRVYILCAENLQINSKNKLKTLEKKYHNVYVDFLIVKDARLEHAVTIAHIPVASYYRLYISKLLHTEERCLYVDGDMIFKHNVEDIYNIEFDDCYAVAVKDMGVQIHNESYQKYEENLEIPDMNTYVNAGFMLFNLSKIREDKIENKMIEDIGYGYKYMDQDILNKYFYGKIKLISQKYDYFVEYYGDRSENVLRIYDSFELEEMEKNSTVYHYTGYFKPWISTRLRINQMWWDEAKLLFDEVTYNNLYQNAIENEKQIDWINVVDNIRNFSTIIIFGFSEMGRNILKSLHNEVRNANLLFVDNDINKQNNVFQGIPIEDIDKASGDHPDAAYIISSQNGYKQIKDQLLNKGVNSENIFRYVHKDETYYNRLDEKYLKYEEEQRIG